MSQIIGIRRVANNGLQGELTDVVSTTARVNVLQKLNKGDDRFNTGTLRHAWFPTTLASLEELGFSKEAIDAIDKLELGERFTCEFKSPTVEGEELTIQITESVIPDKYQYENTAKAAKQIPITKEIAANKALNTQYDLSKYIGDIGYFVDEAGNYIFSRSTVTVKSQVKHTMLSAQLVPSSEMSEFGVTLHEPIAVEQKQTV